MTIINEFKATLISIVIFLNSSKAIFYFTHGLTFPYEAGFFLYHLHKPCFTDTSLLRGPARGGGVSHVARLNFKTSRVSVFKCLSLIVDFAITIAIWPREVVSCRNFILRAVATFWAMLLVGIYPGRVSITDSLLCPWEKKALTFSLNATRLIRTLSVALYVFILTGFDCILVFIKVFS